ncbi:serine hydrolase [Shewanella loihica]|uniref:Beta-lactamase n=1 Tax=Shewanella loihica (strain ATCC BAA-1088 / PV-4) TaxID=323850 RepID=A3QH82_SHELP|nr:serine hydrolase domain-containing protein [Shewanella loihica]ABO24830.1 beta-lactamase [Shewanella loihica PV-4]
MKMSVVASSLCLLGAIASGRVSASEFVIVDKLEQAVAERAILPSAHDSVSGANFAELGSVFDSIIAANERPFYGVIALMQHGEVRYVKANPYGEAAAPTLDSRVMLASQSKMITAALMMQAVSQGKLALEDKINPYLASNNLPTYDERITIAQLLSHSSGIAPQGKANRFAPGSDFQYSNLGYQMLAQLLEITYQQDFATLVNAFLSEHGVEGIKAQLGAQQGLIEGIEIATQEPMEYEVQMNLLPGGGMTGSAKGLLDYLWALHGGKLLSDDAYQAMVAPQILRPHRWSQLYYGFGVQVNQQGIKEYSHSGYLPGYQSLSLSYPESDTYLVVLENASWPIDQSNQAFGLHDKLRRALRETLMAGSKFENNASAPTQSRL